MVESLFSLSLLCFGMLLLLSVLFFVMRLALFIPFATKTADSLATFMNLPSQNTVTDTRETNDVAGTINLKFHMKSQIIPIKLRLDNWPVVPVLPPGITQEELMESDIASTICVTERGYSRCEI